MSDSDFFVASSWGRTEAFFSGYAFTEDSLIFGSLGALSYRESKGEFPAPMQDGCYATCYPDGDDFCIGTDALGAMPLFLYSKGKEWAVSNSFILLAEHLREHGVSLEIDRPALHAFTAGDERNLLALQTALKQIRLVPAGVAVRIRSGLITFDPPVSRSRGSYSENLKTGLERWAGRIEALRHDGRFSITVGVSGGLDTRSILGFVVGSRLGRADLSGLRFFSRVGEEALKGWENDLRVSRQIGERYGFETTDREDTCSSYIDPSECYREWLLRCVGHYSGVDPRIHETDYFSISLRGLGGEFLRPQYKGQTLDEIMDEQLSSYRLRFMRTGRITRNRITAMFSSEELKKLNYPTAAIAYYNQTKGRPHLGRVMRRSTILAPLSGKDFQSAVCALDASAIQRGQIFYDMIFNLEPGLLEIEYDKAGKDPRPACAEHVTEIANLVPKVPKIFIHEKPRSNVEEGSNPEQFFRKKLIDVACELPFPLALREFSVSRYRRLLDFLKMKESSPIILGPRRDTRPLNAAALLVELKRLTS